MRKNVMNFNPKSRFTITGHLFHIRNKLGINRREVLLSNDLLFNKVNFRSVGAIIFTNLLLTKTCKLLRNNSVFN